MVGIGTARSLEKIDAMTTDGTPSNRWRFLGSGRRLPGSPLAYLLLALAVAAGSWNYVAGVSSQAEARRLNGVMAGSERVLSTMKDLETGLRGFALTGAAEYLEPYDAALARLGSELSDLDDLTADPGTRERRGAPVGAEKAFAAQVINPRRAAG